MSADDGVYVLVTKKDNGDEYRVTIANSASNVFLDVIHLVEMFDKAQTFNNSKDAHKYATELPPTEHGISYIHKFREFTWEEISETYRLRLIQSM